MYYQPEFLHKAWADYLHQNALQPDQVDPDAFVRWTYARALAHRQPRYAAMAKNWGISVTAEEVRLVKSASDFETLIGRALDRRQTTR